MPPYTRGRATNLYYLPLVTAGAAAANTLYYAFTTQDIDNVTGIGAGAKALLGHLLAMPAGGIAIVGANSPKPPRVKKALANAAPNLQSSVTTFCAPAQLAAAKGQGWKTVKQGKKVSFSSGRKTVAVYATLSNNSCYVFRLNRADFAAHGVTLGLQLATTLNTDTERARAFSGATRPRPGQATLETFAVAAGGDADASPYTTFTTFYSTSEEEAILSDPAGNWTVSGEILI